MAEDSLDNFINEILTKKQLPGMTDDVKIQLVDDLKERLLDQVNRAIVNSLPDDKINEFNDFLDTQDRTEEEMQQFISNTGVEIKSITAQTMLVFRDLYLQTPEQREA